VFLDSALVRTSCFLIHLCVITILSRFPDLTPAGFASSLSLTRPPEIPRCHNNPGLPHRENGHFNAREDRRTFGEESSVTVDKGIRHPYGWVRSRLGTSLLTDVVFDPPIPSCRGWYGWSNPPIRRADRMDDGGLPDPSVFGGLPDPSVSG
jgi:hypothetical protein